MAIVAPPVGALVGGSLFGRMGAAVGWLIGSWLFQPKQQRQNDIFDPGAQEMPRFNQALRGVTMPVLFGTNRVSSQIVWQNNFTTIRNETSETSGGGKLGGSGGKGGTATGTGSVDYQYKWDMIYHLGMTPERYNLFGAWIGSERVNDDDIISILNSQPSTPFFFGIDEDRPQNASLVFESSFFFDGDGPGLTGAAADIDGWSHLATEEGSTIRWPHTSYVGFKQLDLGGTPHIPQLTWEIGPGEALIDFQTVFIGSDAGLTTEWSIGPIVKDTDGTRYVITHTTSGAVALIFNAETGAIVDTVTTTELDTWAHDLGLDPGSSWTFNVLPGCGALNDEYFLLWANGGGGEPRYAFLLCTMNTDGTPNVVGGYQVRSGFFHNWIKEPLALSFANSAEDTEPMILCYNNLGSGGNDSFILVLPTVTQFKSILIDDSTGPFPFEDNLALLTTDLDVRFGVHASHRDYSAFSWFLPTGLTQSNTRFYFYIGKSDVEWHNDNPASASGNQYIYDTLGTYPNGWVGYYNLGAITHGTTPVVSGDTSGGGNDPFIANDDFIERFKTGSAVPFDDSGENLDGTVDNNDDYMPDPSIIKLITGQATGAFLVIFSKRFTGSEDLSPTGTYTKNRAFIYNPATNKYIQFDSSEGSNLDTVSDIGLSEALRYFPVLNFQKIYYDEATKKLVIIQFVQNAVTQDMWSSDAGTFDLSGGSDVLPPYIIREILVNDWFGIGISSSLIDNDSYLAALAYCDTNAFRVSVQYRKEESTLDVIDELLSVYGGFLTISQGKVFFKRLEFESSTVRTLDNHHLINEPGNSPIRITKGALQDGFNKVRVNYIDRALDYKQNQVEEADEVDQDINGIRMREFPPKFVMSEQTARTMALRALWSNLYSRDTYEFTIGWKDSDLEPGDVITLVDSYHPNLASGVTARIVHWREVDRGLFDIVAKQEHEYIMSSSGFVLDATSQSNNDIIGKIPQPRYFSMYELPSEFQINNDQGALYVGWVPDEFAAGAILYVSADGVTFAPSIKATPYPFGGTLLTDLPSAGQLSEGVEFLLFPKSDWTTANQSYYFNTTLNEAAQATRAVGGSLIWIGSEMIAYETINLVGQNRYRMNKVYRGWGGTPIQAHNSGDFWHKHGGGIFSQAFNEDKIGQTIYYKVAPFNLAGLEFDVASITAKTYTILGGHYLPQNPPTPRFIQDSVDHRGIHEIWVGSASDIHLDWRDSARKSGFGAGGFGIGAGGYGRFTTDPQSHNWRVEVYGSGNFLVRSLEVTTATYNYTNSNNFDDNGAWRGNVAFKITTTNDFGDSPRTEVVSLELWQ